VGGLEMIGLRSVSLPFSPADEYFLGGLFIVSKG
jgi:hypothetical protein